MEYNQIEIQELKTKMKQGQSLDDLADLVNYIINLQNSKEQTNYKPVSTKRLKHYYANINKKYVKFEIPKKTGGVRTITAPDKFLKKIQRRINLLICLFFEVKSAAHGFVEERSIVSNAKIHVGKKYVLNVDLKDFFPSIHFGRIKAVLQIPIFGNKGKNILANSTLEDLSKFGLKPEFAQIFSNLCCFEGKLPQGAPTSPIVTNIVSQKLDYKLVKLAKEYHCFYTRYADDITFSCDKNRFKNEFMKKLDEIIKSEGFIINEKKTRIQKKSVRQEVTGIIVNEKLNLQRNYLRKVRAAMSNWEKHGYEKANAKFASYYPLEKGFLRNRSIPPIENVLSGKILFLGMVRGKDDSIYLKYVKKYKDLINLKNEGKNN
jgi:RNA-directed DNA polymerase